MRILVHGQQAFGKTVLERLLERGDNVVGVFTAPDKEGRPVDPLKELALEHNLPVHQPASWKNAEALDLVKSFDADVCMMAYVLLFVPEAVLNAPRLGSFQYHPSLLPDHRGPSSINWPIAFGKTKTGLSIFWPDDGLDEGPVLMQKECEIGPDETLGEVYFNKLFPMGVDAMIESLDLVIEGNAPKIAQNLEDGSYESWFGKEQAQVDWSKPAADIYNTIRAGNPQPGAWTTFKGAELKIYESAKDDGIRGKPGEVVDVSSNGVSVASGNGGVLVKRVKAAGQKKIPASEFAVNVGMVPGTILGD